MHKYRQKVGAYNSAGDMMTMRFPTLPLSLVALMLLAGFVSVQPVSGQECSQNDAGICGDAGDSRGTARTLPGEFALPSFHRFTGTMGRGETDDWYRFSIPSISLTGAGRPALEVTLFSDWGNTFSVELYKQSSSSVQASGRGDVGKYLEHQLDESGSWYLRIFTEDSQSGHYTFTVDLIVEDDAGSGRDAGTGTGFVQLGTISGTPSNPGTLDFTGRLTRGDSGDRYRFSAPSSSAVLVAIKHSQNVAFTFTLDTGGTPNKQEGPGFQTIWRPAPGGGGSTTYDILVGRISQRPNDAGPYRISILVGFSETPNQDPGGSNDADGSTLTQHELPKNFGLWVGHAAIGDFDWYRLGDVQAGDLIEVGASSYKASALRPHVALALRNSAGDLLVEVLPCSTAHGITWTAQSTGHLYVEVRKVTGTACTGAALTATSDGYYALFYAKRPQGDPGVTGDAPASTSAANAYPAAQNDRPLTGTLDRHIDHQDSYSIGSRTPGTVVRVFVASVVPGMSLQIDVTSATQGSLGSAATSTSGVAAFHQSVTAQSVYRVSVSQPASSAGDGTYRIFVRITPNEPPPSSTLQPFRLIPQDVGRTTVTLRWTPSPDLDFARYEVHAATGSSISPGEGTVRLTVNERPANSGSFVERQVSGLNAGTQYTFLIRTVDAAGNAADSNTRTATTSGTAIGNNPPELSNGRVSPQQGSTTTQFTFSVEYRDADGDAPTQRRVVISGSPHVMSSSGTDYTSGVTYTFTTTLSAGNKEFYFEFSDGAASARNPSSGSHPGPSVQEGTNRAPTNLQVSANPREGEAPLEVQFSITATDPDGDSLSYRWEFGDGGTSNAQSPKHTYTEHGDYTATGFASDGKAESSKSVSIKVFDPSNQAPTTNPSAEPAAGVAPLTVQFRANAQDPDGTIASYEWDFDNSDGIQVDSTQANPTHTYTQAGSFVATVKVTDNGGRTATGTVTVTVSTESNQPPTVTIDATPRRGEAPLEVQFRADGFDPDGDPLTYTWDFDAADGIQNEATGQEVTHVFTTPGAFTVTVRASDPDGATATGTARITVDPPPGGSGQLFIEADPRRGNAPLNVTFTADTSGMPAPPRTYSWDFGDGATSTEGPTTSHVFDEEGRYEVTLNVTDTNGALYTSTIVIEAGSSGSPGIGFAAIVAGLAVAAFLAVRRARPGKDS